MIEGFSFRFGVDMSVIEDFCAEAQLQSDPIILKCRIPRGLEIRPTTYGRGLFSNASFQKGEVIYRGTYWVIPDIQKNIVGLFRKYESDEEDHYAMDVMTHSVQRKDGFRHLYSFDGFMNHSCSPNSLSPNSTEIHGENEGVYNTIALKDISPGDELTCDYNIFEWDCEDKGILNCLCGAPNCRKEIRGFKYLPLEDQLTLLPFASEIIRAPWSTEHPNIPLPDIQNA